MLDIGETRSISGSGGVGAQEQVGDGQLLMLGYVDSSRRATEVVQGRIFSRLMVCARAIKLHGERKKVEAIDWKQQKK